jgi:hypothetical protein
MDKNWTFWMTSVNPNSHRLTVTTNAFLLDKNCRPALSGGKFLNTFASKKVSRWIEHGVKVEFSKGVSFAPKPSVTKFVDPQDVDFAIKDLLKGRHIGILSRPNPPQASKVIFVVSDSTSLCQH